MAMTDDEFKTAVLGQLREFGERLDEIDQRSRHMLDYVGRVEVHTSGLDTKLRDVLTREATVSNVARDAYHQWLLSFDAAKRAQLVAAVRPVDQALAEREVTKLLETGSAEG